jgi:hypothetical protein
MTLALRPRRVPHPRFPAFDSSARLETREHAATALGAFYEHVTAALVGGHRVRVDRSHGDNPDVVAGDQRFESKATSSGRWVLNREQLETYVTRPRMSYVLWHYRAPDAPLVSLGTVRALHDWCASHVRHVYVIAADLIPKILAHSPYAAPRYSNRRWGWNYFLPAARVRAVLERRVHRHPIPPWTHVVRDDLFAGARVCDVDVAAFPVTTIAPVSYFVSAHDQALAAAALVEFARDRLRVVLIPSSQPDATHKVRSVESRNPRWYEIFMERRIWQNPRNLRRKKPHRMGDRRRLVRAALELLAAGRAHPLGTWIGWELLGLLREAEEREARR